MTITFDVIGEPATQGSMRPISGRVMGAASKRLRPWREDVGWSAKAARPRGFALLRGPVMLEARFRVGGRTKDLDKLLRAVLDALTGVIYVDDRQVYDIRASVFPLGVCVPGATPGVTVTVIGQVEREGA